MQIVFALWHEYQPDPEIDHDEIKFIGVYSTMAKAEAARDQLRTKPGFRDWPDAFRIDEEWIDDTSWEEGFACV